MDRYTSLTGVRTTPTGRIKTMRSDDATKFYIELEFNEPLKVQDLAELCRDGNIYNYSKGLIGILEKENK